MRRERGCRFDGAGPAAGSPFFSFGVERAVEMKIRVADRESTEELCAHFRRAGFRAAQVAGGVIEVGRDDAPTPEQEEREVSLHLRVWQAVHPDAEAELLPSGGKGGRRGPQQGSPPT